MGLVHQPRLLFLDEPSTGLDPQSRANLWGHIASLRDDLNTTVFLTTHYMDEADLLCDRILVIDYGEIVARGTPDELKRSVHGDLVRIGFAGEENATTVATIVSNVDGASEPEIQGNEVRFRVPDGAGSLPGFLREMVAKDIDLTAVEVHRPTLDDVFLTLTGRSLREDETTSPAEQAA